MDGKVYFVLFYVFWAINGCSEKPSEPYAETVTVSSSYLHAAVMSISGGEIEVNCLTPPGMCPGHFDLSPRQMNTIRNSSALIRFDFQQNLEPSLKRFEHLAMHAIHTNAGLCVPSTYVEVCRQIEKVLCENFPEHKAVFQERLSELEISMEQQAAQWKQQITDAGLNSSPILTSHHQADFVQWLGLDVTATFVGSEAATPSQINHCLEKASQKQIRYVVANRQEGTDLASALASRLDAEMVVFSNFPDILESPGAYEEMVSENINQLLHGNTEYAGR